MAVETDHMPATKSRRDGRRARRRRDRSCSQHRASLRLRASQERHRPTEQPPGPVSTCASRLLQNPDDVIGKQQQQDDEGCRQPEPTSPASQSVRGDATAIHTAPCRRSIQHPKRHGQGQYGGGAEPGPQGIESCQGADPGATDAQQDQRQRHDAADRCANGGDARANDGWNRRFGRGCLHQSILASVPRYGVKPCVRTRLRSAGWRRRPT